VRALAGKMASWGLNWGAESDSIWSQIVQVIENKVDEMLEYGLKEAHIPEPIL